MFFKKEKKYNFPWEKYYDGAEKDIDVPNISIYSYLVKKACEYPNKTAINYFGKLVSYKQLIEKIESCVLALDALGIHKGDVVTLCMPNTPETVYSFYACNKIGAIVNIIHPLSSREELKNSLITTKSKYLIASNVNYENIKDIVNLVKINKLILASPAESMPPVQSLGYFLISDSKLSINYSEKVISWKDFIALGKNNTNIIEDDNVMDDDAVYLHSGGTTGTPKSIVLTNKNINAVLQQARIIFPKIGVGDIFLSILPMFHCFGLVVCVCAPLSLGCQIALVPKFDAKRFDKLIKKYRPTVLTGVPTLFEALITNPYMINVDLSFVKYIISGGDSLSIEKNKAVNSFLHKHKCEQTVIQGYGMTETTGPACAGVLGSDKLGSVGVPLPGNEIRIVNPETFEELKTKEIGEICISGPAVMSRYLNNQKETDNLIKIDDKNKKWVHTGDLGYIDEDGVLFFVQRLKRMLIVSGYNVYPSHIENVIMQNEYVQLAAVIGVPHPYKVQEPVLFVIPKQGVDANTLVLNLQKFIKENLAKYMIPKKIIVRDELPKTMIGKVDYRKLEEEYLKK